MSRTVVGLTAVALSLIAVLNGVTLTSARIIATTPNGAKEVDLTVWGPHSLPRIRLYPTGADRTQLYEVTDVIVAKETEQAPKVNCPTAGNCDATLTETTSLDLIIGDEKVIVNYKVNGAPQIVAELQTSGAQGTTRFPDAKRLYGIPEHATDLTLKEGMTYRLMNLDVFKYKLDDGGGIYGSIPFLMAHSTQKTSGVLWLNSADTNVNILGDDQAVGIGAEWKSKAGIIDIFFVPGPTPAAAQQQHASLTGPVYLPPLFALGYHQCRWNYRSSEDSLDVDNGFDVHNIPYDVLWLDIEHTNGKKYFTWDYNNFPEPQALVDHLSAKGRKLVTISDPHIKREGGYHVHDQATSLGYYVKTEAGNDFEGHCWPGTSSWVDFYNSKAREWYASLFKYENYPGSTPDVYTWVDMNEPSVFNAHEVTMDDNAVHTSADGKKVRHVELHNMYGFYHTMAAFQGHIVRNSAPPHRPTRPFILTRSFFAGSQRYAAMWTGDNMGEWSHLTKSIPMLLALAVANFPFAGADVGGFFNNPPEKLFVRWFQAGIFYPFFRGHAHLETKRREPWLFGPENTRIIRNAIALRYSLIPYLYTSFYKAHRDGDTVIRPMFYEFPHDESQYDQQQSFMFGPSLLVRPITEEQETPSIDISLPSSEIWYALPTGQKYTNVNKATVAVTPDTIPMFLRGGHVLPLRTRLRRSTAAMYYDPITLHIAVNGQGNAFGELYLDDSISYDYQSGGYLLQQYSFTDGVLTAKEAPRRPGQAKTFKVGVEIERIIVYGLHSTPATAYITVGDMAGSLAEIQTLGDHNVVIVRRPQVDVNSEWSVRFEF